MTQWIKGVVTSVPHSGTRTLVEYLDGSLVQSPRGEWLHFGFDDARLKHHKDLHLHIPLRNPVRVAKSWAGRGKNIDGLLAAYASMFNHLDRPHTLHKMEDIPATTGTEDWDRTVEGNRLVAQYVAQVTERVIVPHHEFFARYY